MTAMIIDGKPGVVGKVDCRNSTRYAIDYPIDYSARDNTMTSVAYIVSTFPWDNGTSNLAKTIHIEKSLPYHTIYIVTPS